MTRPHNTGHLTPREREIVEALSTGKTLVQIAREQQRAYGTIRNQADSIRKRVGVHSMLQVVVAYFRMRKRRSKKIGETFWERPPNVVPSVPASNVHRPRPIKRDDSDILRSPLTDEERLVELLRRESLALEDSEE